MANKRTKHTGRDAHATCRRFRRKGHSTRTATHTPSSPDTPDPGPSSHAGARRRTGGRKADPAPALPPRSAGRELRERPRLSTGHKSPFGTTCPPRQRTRASAPSCAGSGLSARRTRCPRAPLGSRGRAPISRARRPLQQVSRTLKRYCTPTSARWDVLHPSPAPRNRLCPLKSQCPQAETGQGSPAAAHVGRLATQVTRRGRRSFPALPPASPQLLRAPPCPSQTPAFPADPTAWKATRAWHTAPDARPSCHRTSA